MKLTLKIIAWIGCVLFLLMGLTYLSFSIIGGLVIILGGLLINPILFKYFKKYGSKYKFNLKPWMSSVIAVVLVIMGIVLVGNTDSYKKNIADVNKAQEDKIAQKKIDDDKKKEEQAQLDSKKQEQKKLDDAAKADADVKAKAEDDKKKADEEAKKKAETKPIPQVPSITAGQKNALASAKSYLSYSAFSRDGLVAQLKYEKYSEADAIYGADNSGADWNEQAAKSAKSYLDNSSFSRGGLIDQLKYEKFTQAQAEYDFQVHFALFNTGFFKSYIF